MAPEHIATTLILCFLAIAAYGAWLGHRGRDEGLPIVVVSGLFALFLTLGSSLVASDRQRSEEFAERKERVVALMYARFDLSCDRLGITKGDRLNCFERDGFRVWREDGKLYAATLNGTMPSIDLIADEDRLLGGSYGSIIHLAPHLDLDAVVRASGPRM